MQVNGKSTVVGVFLSLIFSGEKKNITVGQYLIADSKHMFLLIRKLSNHNEFHYPVHFSHIFFVLPYHMHLMYSTERN